ncbi:Ig-like domain-containing protein [Candidatus Desantisbacteria bacterium]|nr:Ig-like domain-containing protein [Candidatus Desantisbacteria bacterium]
MKIKKMFFSACIISMFIFISIFVNLCYAGSDYILLYSTPGYDTRETKRVLVRAYTDPVSFVIDEANSSWKLYDVNSNSFVMSGQIKSLGRTFGVDLWEVDFSSLRAPGRYQIKVYLESAPLSNTVLLTTESFDVKDNIFFDKNFRNLTYLNAEERAASAYYGYGFYDCNSRMGEANSHGMFLAGLVNAYVLKENVLTINEKTRLINAINKSVDYLLSLYLSTGELRHEYPTRPGQDAGPGIWHTYEGLYGLVTFMNHFHYIDPVRSNSIHDKIPQIIQYLDTNGGWPRPLKIVVYYYLYNFNNADTQYKDLAISFLNAQMAVFNMSTVNRGWPFPIFQGLYLLANAFPDNPAYDTSWIPNANRIVNNYCKYLLDNNGFHVFPQGSTNVDWNDMVSIPKAWSQDPYPHNFYANGPYGARVQDAVYLAALTGKHKILKPLMSGSLGWVKGLNLGIPSQYVSGVTPAEPIACASFIINTDKYSKPWTYWEWGPPTSNVQSIVNGFYIVNGALVYNNYDWQTGETFILTDGTYIQGSSVYENYLQTFSSTLISIEISPESASIVKGGTQQFKAIGTYLDSSLGDLTSSVTWSSSNNEAATINSNGLAQSIELGNTNITANLNNITSNIASLSIYRNNHAPVFQPSIGNRDINENQLLTIYINGVDPDGDPVSYSAAGLPSGANFDSTAGIFTWTPAYSQSGTYNVAFTVSDGYLANSELITITVQDVSKPDLIMTALSTTSTKVAPGSTLIVSNTVKNQGVIASSKFTIGFHLSQDTIYGGSDDVVFATVRSVASLGVGASSASSTTLTIPANTPLGNYYICAFADKDEVITEISEQNNTISTLIPIEVTEADLIMTAVNGPGTGITGTSISVSSTVRNQGTGTISSFTIGIYLSSDVTITTSDTRIGTRTVSSLNGAGSNTATTTSLLIPTSLTGGTYYIGAIADYNNARKESDEINNALTGNTIDITSGVDAIVTALSGPSSGATGTSISITSTVKNQGIGTMSASTLGIYLSTDANITTSDTRLGTASITALAAGASSTVTTSLTIPLTLSAGQYYIGAIADYNNARKESDETNNALTGNTIDIISGVDAIVTDVNGPASGITGISISVTSTVKNQGIGTMSASTLGIYISTDAVITTSDIRLGTASIATLAPGVSSTVSKSFVVPSTLAAGIYYIGAKADYNNAIKESDETNNALTGNTIDLTKP